MKETMTLILLPIAKENMHTSSDLPIPYDEL
jgi:hypothetical protein